MGCYQPLDHRISSPPVRPHGADRVPHGGGLSAVPSLPSLFVVCPGDTETDRSAQACICTPPPVSAHPLPTLLSHSTLSFCCPAFFSFASRFPFSSYSHFSSL